MFINLREPIHLIASLITIGSCILVGIGWFKGYIVITLISGSFIFLAMVFFYLWSKANLKAIFDGWKGPEEGDILLQHKKENLFSLKRLIMQNIVFKIMLDSGQSIKDRIKAIAALPGLEPYHKLQPVINLLKDNNQIPIIRRAVAEALSLIGSTEAIEPLCEVLNDPEPLVVKSAALALQSFNIALDGFSALRRCLYKHWENHLIIPTIIDTINQIAFDNKYVEVIEPMQKFLMEKEELNLLQKAIDIIVRIDGSTGAKALYSVLKSGRFPENHLLYSELSFNLAKLSKELI